MIADWNVLPESLQVYLAQQAFSKATETIAGQAEVLAQEFEDGGLADRGGAEALRLMVAIVRAIGAGQRGAGRHDGLTVRSARPVPATPRRDAAGTDLRSALRVRRDRDEAGLAIAQDPQRHRVTVLGRRADRAGRLGRGVDRLVAHAHHQVALA